ncbi:hypothetical protein PHLGIDRAFT_310584 [Phlebiopsis gigantea 11061_1 CR5-6]|uniref:Uncharacterized protein n=1 Tax=Phlebiopsis gigantea (strain 11061_1 CR5-6) TaxID=745531 RepID=A0A0C3NC65_PHLG1|nr:hypothetical protein PHLGIDRAFT_310584 [Phlebiopsis gigantea 11061_1 CR5-6]
MSPASSAGGFYHPQDDSIQPHSHDANASHRPAQGQTHEIYPRDLSYQASNAHWAVPVSSTLRRPSPHNPSPSGSQVSLPEHPSPSTESSMITPYYYDQADQQAPDVGDYQQWVDSFNATHHGGYPFPAGQQPSNLAHIAYQSTAAHHQHSSVPASMLIQPSVMQAGPQNHYHFVPSPYSAEAQAPPATTYQYGFGNQPAGTSPAGGIAQPGYGGHTLPENTLSASTIASQHQASMHNPYVATTSGMTAGYPTHSLVGDNAAFTFDYPTPGSSGSDPVGNPLQNTPGSEPSGLPSTPSSRPSTGHQTQPAPAANPGRIQFVNSSAPPKTSKKAKGNKRVRVQAEVESDSGSEGEDGQSGTAVPPLKGPDGAAIRLYVFSVICSHDPHSLASPRLLSAHAHSPSTLD